MPLAKEDPLHHVVDHHFGWGWLQTIGFTQHVFFLLIVGALCILVFPLITRRIKADGTGGRLATFFEVLLLYIRDEVSRPFLGKEGDRFLPIIWTFFFFILFCNLVGLIPGSRTATSNISVTAALALVSFVFYTGIGIQRHGFFRYLKASILVGPPSLWIVMAPVEILGQMMRPFALAVRLFANMVAGHTMLAVFFMFCIMAVKSGSILMGGTIAVLSVFAAVCVSFLEILVAFLQAFIFTFLTTVFLSMAIHPEH